MTADFKIKVLIMDVDGTLTDGGIYIGNGGESFKKFHVKDGYGICNILPRLGIVPVVITGRKSLIVKERCEELGIKNVFQGSFNKIETMQKLLDKLGVSQEEVAYIGDDMNDYEAMQMAGLRGCPGDAATEIKKISDYITESAGGSGAVREFIEWLEKRQIAGEIWDELHRF